MINQVPLEYGESFGKEHWRCRRYPGRLEIDVYQLREDLIHFMDELFSSKGSQSFYDTNGQSARDYSAGFDLRTFTPPFFLK